MKCRHCGGPAKILMEFDDGEQIPVCHVCEAYEAGVRKDQDGTRRYKRTPIKSAGVGGDSPYELPEEQNERLKEHPQCADCERDPSKVCENCWQAKLAYQFTPDFSVFHEPKVKELRWATTGVAMVAHELVDHQLMFEMLQHGSFDRPHAYGTLTLTDNWDAVFDIDGGNMDLGMVDKRVRKFCREHGWNFKGIVDDDGIPFEMPKKTAGSRPLYHITDRHDFALDPNYEPQDNTFAIEDRSGRKGVYLTDSPDRWRANGYHRPYVAEIDVPEGLDGEERWHGERFLPAEHFDKAQVRRVIPFDQHQLEKYGEPGTIEHYLGTPASTGDRDARTFTPEEHAEHLHRIRDYLHDVQGFGWNEFDEQGYHVGTDEIDDEGMPIRRDRDGNVMTRGRYATAIGEDSNGPKTWSLNEWAGTETHDQMPAPGFDVTHEEEPIIDDGRYYCDECDENLPSYRALRQHRREHRAPRMPSGRPEPVVDYDDIFPPHFLEQTPLSDRNMQSSVLMKYAANDAAVPSISGPIPVVWDLEADTIQTGRPGERVSDITDGKFTPGVVEGLYDPKGNLQMRTDTDLPWSVKHLVDLWYAMMPELPVKGVFRLVGEDRLRLASESNDELRQLNEERGPRFTPPTHNLRPMDQVRRADGMTGDVITVDGDHAQVYWRDDTTTKEKGADLIKVGMLDVSEEMARFAADEEGLAPDDRSPIDRFQDNLRMDGFQRVNEIPNVNPHIPSKVGDHVYMDYPGKDGVVVRVRSTPEDWEQPHWMSRPDDLERDIAKYRDDLRWLPNSELHGSKADTLHRWISEAEQEIENYTRGVQENYEDYLARTDRGEFFYDIDWGDGNVGTMTEGRRVWPQGHLDPSEHFPGRFASILDDVQEHLPPVFDDPTADAPDVLPEIRQWVWDAIRQQMIEAGWPDPDGYLTLVLTGSLTTYQFDESSDFDTSLFIDAERLPDWVRADLIAALRPLADLTVPGTNFNLETYVVPEGISLDDLYKPGLRSGYILAGVELERRMGREAL